VEYLSKEEVDSCFNHVSIFWLVIWIGGHLYLWETYCKDISSVKRTFILTRYLNRRSSLPLRNLLWKLERYLNRLSSLPLRNLLRRCFFSWSHDHLEWPIPQGARIHWNLQTEVVIFSSVEFPFVCPHSGVPLSLYVLSTNITPLWHCSS
jgi:hypothetical protein